MTYMFAGFYFCGLKVVVKSPNKSLANINEFTVLCYKKVQLHESWIAFSSSKIIFIYYDNVWLLWQCLVAMTMSGCYDSVWLLSQ